MSAHALTLARIALILALNGLTALFAGDALARVPMIDPATALPRPVLLAACDGSVRPLACDGSVRPVLRR
jgi:hypothetical protein